MPNIPTPKSESRRFAVDSRCWSQLAWLRRVSVLAADGQPPSYSQLIRRAVSLLTEHVATMIEAGRVDGLPGPRQQDTAAEQAALSDHARLVASDAPRAMVNSRGHLLMWRESLSPAQSPSE